MNYVNLIMSSSYNIFDSVNQEIKHEDFQENCNKNCPGVIAEVDPQLVRDSRAKDLYHEVKGELIQCNKCSEHFNTSTLIH